MNNGDYEINFIFFSKILVLFIDIRIYPITYVYILHALNNNNQDH